MAEDWLGHKKKLRKLELLQRKGREGFASNIRTFWRDRKPSNRS
nr:MAG TPA: 4-hydroxyphenylpyruvate dioxygenase [Caudoviricetes sp.]